MIVFSLIWLFMIAVVWIVWTIEAWYEFLLWFSYHYTKNRTFWIKQGKPIWTDHDEWNVWIVVHLGALFIASLAVFLFGWW